MNKKTAKEIVIKWAEVIARGAGTGIMTHPTEGEREQIFEAIGVMKNLKTSQKNDFKVHKSSPNPCPECKGSGKSSPHTIQQEELRSYCPTCKGQGFIKS